MVAYDDRIDVIVRSTPASAEAKADAKRAVRTLTARGSTNLCDGWLTGCQQIAEYLQQEAIGRCLLLTDGLANSGVTQRDQLVFHADNLRQRRVTTSTFGVGADFDEGLLSALAEAGGGNFYFIENAHDIPRFMAAELQETAEIVARDCTLQVTASAGCEVESLNEYPTTRTPDGWLVAVGSLVSGQVIEPLLRIRLPATPVGETLTVSVRLQSRDVTHGASEALATFRAAQDTDYAVQPRDVVVDRRRAALEAARAQRRAALLNRDRDFQGARREIHNAMERIRRYAADDPEMASVLARLVSDQERFSGEMDMIERKRHYSQAAYTTKERMVEGTSRRRALGRGLLLLPATPALVAPCQRAARAIEPSLRGAIGRIAVSEGLVRSLFQTRAGAVLAPSDELGVAETAALIGREHAIRVVVTDAGLVDNWFSHWHAPQRTAIVSQAAWEQVGGLDRAAHIGYEALLYGLHAVTPRYDVLGIAARGHAWLPVRLLRRQARHPDQAGEHGPVSPLQGYAGATRHRYASGARLLCGGSRPCDRCSRTARANVSHQTSATIALPNGGFFVGAL